MSGALGTFLHSLIRVFKIDVFFKVLRFSNEWNYYFKGEILSTSEFKGGKKGKVLSTNIDLLIEDDTEKNKMVSGYLTQYTLSSKTGELETIYLTNAKRYSKSENKFKEIPGDCFIVPFNKVIDMNLIYNTIKVASNEKKQLTYNLILNIGFLGIIFLFIYPWFLKISFFQKFSGIVFSILSGFLLIVIASSPFQTNPASKLSRKTFWAVFIFMIVFGIFAILFLHLIPAFDHIFNF